MKLDNPRSCSSSEQCNLPSVSDLKNEQNSCPRENVMEYFDITKGPFEQCYGLGVRTDDAIECCLQTCSGSTKECNDSCRDNAWQNTNFQKCVDKMCLPEDKVVKVGDNRFGRDCISREGENLINCCMDNCKDNSCKTDCANIKNAISYFVNKKAGLVEGYLENTSAIGLYIGIGLFCLMIVIGFYLVKLKK